MNASLTAVFLRHGASMLWHRSDEGWSPLLLPVDPDDTVGSLGAALQDRVGVAATTVVRATGPLGLAGDRCPASSAVLVDVPTDTVATTAAVEYGRWMPIDALYERDTPEWLWDCYHRVAPSVRSIAADRDHGSSYLAVRALEVLRDQANLLVREGDSGEELDHLGSELRSVRPDMVALKVRVAEVLEVGDRPEAVRDRAVRAIADAVESDTKAAEAAAAALDTGAKFFVFSRSETVLSALDALDPEQLSTTVAEPGGEGVDVAESLADHVSVELGPDTAVATMLADGADAVVVGADGIDADGTVVNKVGTRTVAAVAAEAGVPVFVVASAVKCCAGVTNDEHGPIRAVYGGDAPIDVRSARFDRTPASLVSGYLTDRGRLDLEAVRELAEGHAALLDRTARR